MGSKIDKRTQEVAELWNDKSDKLFLEAAKLSKEEAIDRLAQHLHRTMERWDSTEPDYTWDKLAPYQQEFLRGCVRELLAWEDLIDVALERPSLIASRIR